MSDDVFVLVRKAGTDTMHHNPGEQCNTDDAERKERVDRLTAESLMRDPGVHRCQHCNRED